MKREGREKKKENDETNLQHLRSTNNSTTNHKESSFQSILCQSGQQSRSVRARTVIVADSPSSFIGTERDVGIASAVTTTCPPTGSGRSAVRDGGSVGSICAIVQPVYGDSKSGVRHIDSG